MEERWRTFREITNNHIFDKVKVGDDVAILEYEAKDWCTGIVEEISTYKDRSTRWITRPCLCVLFHDTGQRGVVYEGNVKEIVFKED